MIIRSQPTSKKDEFYHDAPSPMYTRNYGGGTIFLEPGRREVKRLLLHDEKDIPRDLSDAISIILLLRPDTGGRRIKRFSTVDRMIVVKDAKSGIIYVHFRKRDFPIERNYNYYIEIMYLHERVCIPETGVGILCVREK